jgi:hypothetical protein
LPAVTGFHFFLRAEEKGWERLAAAKKEADLMAVELADTIYFSNNANRKKVA